MFNGQETDMYMRALYGANAQRAFVQLCIQQAGEHSMLVGQSTPNLIHAQARNFPSQLIIGEIIIRPHHIFTGKNHQGAGAGGLLHEGVWPDRWDYIIRNGVLQPNDFTMAELSRPTV